MKQLATQARQVEKEKMKAWKQLIMQEVAEELQLVRQGYEQAMETQRHDFVMELGRVIERLHEVESEATMLKKGVAALRPQKIIPNLRSTPSASKSPTASPNSGATETPKNTVPIARSYAQIAASSSIKMRNKKRLDRGCRWKTEAKKHGTKPSKVRTWKKKSDIPSRNRIA